jgi:translation elongation factor P/translation initiation factor 5A
LKTDLSYQLTHVLFWSFSPDKLMEIVKIQHTLAAQSRASMQTELRDVRTGNKGAERFRVTESVESAYPVLG